MPLVTKDNFAELAMAAIKRRGEGVVLSNPFCIEARLWMAYFETKGIPAGFVTERLAAGNPCTFPTQTPAEFDPEATSLRPKPLREEDRTAAQLTAEEREEAIQRFRRIFPAAPVSRSVGRVMREAPKPLPPVVTPDAVPEPEDVEIPW
jgi:hypothetical protein